jgi:pimeloyl-ACP methyl ester carboxylesterase
VVTVDLAGHGESGLGRDEWSMEAFGQDVAAVVQELGLEDVVLIGHSMGGPVVVEAARRLNDRVVGVVGVDTFNDLSRSYSDEEVQGFVQGFQEDFAEAVRGVVGTMFVPDSDPELASWITEDMASADPTVGMGALEGMIVWYNNESRAALRELPAPLRLVNSDYNPTNVEAGREAVPSFDAVFMSGVGHFVMMEDPETFNALLSEAITAFLPATAAGG